MRRRTASYGARAGLRAFCLLCLSALLSSAFAQDGAEYPNHFDALDASCDKLRSHHGGTMAGLLMMDRLESQAEHDNVLSWEGYAWIGGDLNKLWLESEGEWISHQETIEKADLQVLYSRAVSPYFDLQTGYRHDFESAHSNHFAVVGVHGLAPYWFELSASAMVGERGDVLAAFAAEYDLLLTQRLIVQPSVELEISAQDISDSGVDSGPSSVEAGVRVRYELHRQFAPYIGVSWHREFGEQGDAGVAFVAGLRTWW